MFVVADFVDGAVALKKVVDGEKVALNAAEAEAVVLALADETASAQISSVASRKLLDINERDAEIERQLVAEQAKKDVEAAKAAEASK